MGTMNILRGLVGGLDQATGNTQGAAELQGINDRANAQKAEPRQMEIKARSLAIGGLQQKLAQLDPKSAEYHDTVAQIQDQVHGMREMLNPDMKLGPSDWLKMHTTDWLHITNHDKRQRQLQQQQQAGVGQDQQTAQSLAQAVPQQQNPFVQKYNEAMAVPGATAEEALGVALPGVKPKVGPETSDTRARGDFDAFKKDHPEYKGSFEQWKTEQAASGRVAATPPKAQSRDDRYIAILQKQQEGQPITPDDKAYSDAYKLWTKETKIDPGVARAIAFGANRYVPVTNDPDDPGKVTFMRVGEAARAAVGSPASIAFQTDKALTRAFTSGQPAQTINYFNTATEHLKQLQQAADALNNGDMQLFNRIGNSYATQTGNPAPTNFATIRNAVAGELSKTFKGAAATDAEIDAINTSINSSQSPAQLSGAIGNNINLMGSKMQALRGQFEEGKKGKPNFPGVNSTPPEGTKSYKANGQIFDIPVAKVPAFLKKYPGAVAQ